MTNKYRRAIHMSDKANSITSVHHHPTEMHLDVVVLPFDHAERVFDLGAN